MIQKSSLCAVARRAAESRSASSLSRFRPSGVSSKNHANAIHSGKATTAATRNQRTTQSGAPTYGASCAIPWDSAHAAAM